MAEPRTERSTSDRDGRPCVHMGDEDGAVLQVHHRADKDTGFLVNIVQFVQLPVPGLPPIPQQADVYLTHGQAQELCDYFRTVL